VQDLDDDGVEGLAGLAARGPDLDRASAAPSSCMATKPGTDVGAMPAKVSDRVRATVMAGLANDVLLVNQ